MKALVGATDKFKNLQYIGFQDTKVTQKAVDDVKQEYNIKYIIYCWSNLLEWQLTYIWKHIK